MYRPDGKCKLCDREFETDFNSETARNHCRGSTGRTIPCKFVPCLHTIFCVECAKREEYIGEKYNERKREKENCIGEDMACPLCETSIKTIVYYLSVAYYNSYGWIFQNLNSNSQ